MNHTQQTLSVNIENFDRKKFIDAVIEAFQFQEIAPDVLQQLQETIDLRLEDRIAATVMPDMTKNDLEQLEKFSDEQPTMDRLEVLLKFAKKMPGMDKKIEKGLNDLFFELTYRAEQLNNRLREQEEESAAA